MQFLENLTCIKLLKFFENVKNQKIHLKTENSFCKYASIFLLCIKILYGKWINFNTKTFSKWKFFLKWKIFSRMEILQNGISPKWKFSKMEFLQNGNSPKGNLFGISLILKHICYIDKIYSKYCYSCNPHL